MTGSLAVLEEQLRSLADMAGSLEPSEAKESTREVMNGLAALERDLEAAKEGSALLLISACAACVLFCWCSC